MLRSADATSNRTVKICPFPETMRSADADSVSKPADGNAVEDAGVRCAVRSCNLGLIGESCRIRYHVDATFDLVEAGRSNSFIRVNEGRVTALEIFSKICLEAVRECGPDSDFRTIEKVVRKRIDALPPTEREAVTAAVESLISYEPPNFQEHGAH